MTIYINQETNVREFDKIEPSFTIDLYIPNSKIVTLKDCFNETFKLEIIQRLQKLNLPI